MTNFKDYDAFMFSVEYSDIGDSPTMYPMANNISECIEEIMQDLLWVDIATVSRIDIEMGKE